jgi:hypothetical protein
MVGLVRHRHTKEPATDRPYLNHRATSRLYSHTNPTRKRGALLCPGYLPLSTRSARSCLLWTLDLGPWTQPLTNRSR